MLYLGALIFVCIADLFFNYKSIRDKENVAKRNFNIMRSVVDVIVAVIGIVVYIKMTN